jgi:hypothetical protein
MNIKFYHKKDSGIYGPEGNPGERCRNQSKFALRADGVVVMLHRLGDGKTTWHEYDSVEAKKAN